MAAILLLGLGVYVIWRFLALGGRRPTFSGHAVGACSSRRSASLPALMDAIGGGGWGPVGTTSLLSVGPPRAAQGRRLHRHLRVRRRRSAAPSASCSRSAARASTSRSPPRCWSAVSSPRRSRPGWSATSPARVLGVAAGGAHRADERRHDRRGARRHRSPLAAVVVDGAGRGRGSARSCGPCSRSGESRRIAAEPGERGRRRLTTGPRRCPVDFAVSSEHLTDLHMRVSAKSDYALRALIELATREDGAPVSAEELGRLQEIPHGFLQAILADLRRAGIVMSQRGQSGGWRMARAAADCQRRRRDPRRRRTAGQRLRPAPRGGLLQRVRRGAPARLDRGPQQPARRLRAGHASRRWPTASSRGGHLADPVDEDAWQPH